MQGKPPTYAEFAQFWQQEYAVRKQKNVTPKKEWAYINFTQNFLKNYPEASKIEVDHAWHQKRLSMIKKIKGYLGIHIKTIFE